VAVWTLIELGWLFVGQTSIEQTENTDRQTERKEGWKSLRGKREKEETGGRGPVRKDG